MKLDRDKFWQLYHKNFDGEVLQPTVDALNKILDFFEDEKRLKFISWFAYVLATAYHESGINGNHFVPVKEGKASKTSSVWIKYQSKYWDTGYYGRGLVQTTWKEKYLAVGELLGVGDLFVKNPDLLLDIKWAYEALVAGMVNGIYRSDSHGKFTLARYLPNDLGSKTEFYNSRDIVNGDKTKNGNLIADYAIKFQDILRTSQTSAVPNSQPAAIPQDVQIIPPSDSPQTLQPPNPDRDSGEGEDNQAEGAETPNSAIPADNSKPPTNDLATVTKERPSPFVKIWTGITAAIGSITALGVNIQSLFDKVTNAITAREVIFLAVGVGLVGLAIFLYDRSASRANKLNQQKLDIASNPALITTELVAKEDK